MTKLFEMKDDGSLVMNLVANDMLRLIENISLRLIDPAVITGHRLNVENTAAFFRAEVIRTYVAEFEDLRPIFEGAGTAEQVADVFARQADDLRAELGRFFDANFLGEDETNIKVMIGKINKMLEKAAVDSRSLGMQELFEPIPRTA